MASSGRCFCCCRWDCLLCAATAGRWLWLVGMSARAAVAVQCRDRFLMPSLPFFALALALVLPRPGRVGRAAGSTR